MSNWNLHYPAWMIGDGEPHRSVGDVFDWFAVEFWSEQPLSIVPSGSRSATPTTDFQYRVSAEVAFVIEKKVVVIDFGLLAISVLGNVQPDVRIRDFVSGTISIGFPLSIEPIPDDLITRMGRQWQVDEIFCRPDGMRDIGQTAYKKVTSTEEAKALDYLLHCKELGQSRVPYPPYTPAGDFE